jgi:hypothetical protein
VGIRGESEVVRAMLNRLVDRNAAVRTQAVVALGKLAGLSGHAHRVSIVPMAANSRM